MPPSQLWLNRSDRFTQLVRPVTIALTNSTGQTGPLTGQTGLRKKKLRAATLPSSVQPIRRSNLRVSLHDLPPLCISADELDTTGVEVNVLDS